MQTQLQDLPQNAAMHGRSATIVVDMKPAKITKHELRTRETRELLLQAAEKIFVRDGYEKADLAEIAELAGRTKGAIYGQFKSKEEVFLALVEVNALRRRAAMRSLLEDSSSTEESLRILRKYFISLASDNVWGLLTLEFKLYTIRNPDARERLSELYKRILPENEEADYVGRLGKPAKGKQSFSRTKAVHASFGILFALQLELAFDPALFAVTDVERIAAFVFDKLFGMN